MQILLTCLAGCCGPQIIVSLLAKQLQDLGATVKIGRIRSSSQEGQQLRAKYHCQPPCILVNNQVFTIEQVKKNMSKIAEQIYSSIPVIQQDFKNNAIFK